MSEMDLDYRALFESAPGLYLVLSADLRVVAATDSYCRVTGLDWHALAGKPYFDILDAEIARRGEGESRSLRASFASVIETKRRDVMPLQRFDLAGQDGAREERYWSVVNVPIPDKMGNVRWIVHRVRDMTQAVRDSETADSQRRLALEQEDLIEALRAANRELADARRKQGDTERLARLDTVALMTSAIAHDISQPLLAAMNYLSAFRRLTAGQDAKPPIEHVEKAEEQLRRAGEIVRKLRSYIAGEELPRRTESIAEIARRAMALSEPLLRLHKIQTTVEIDVSLPQVAVDRTQMEQVLVNILKNAAEAMRESRERRIDLRAGLQGRTVRIEIADTGPGIPPAIAKDLFEPFRSQKPGGLGLGLAICREIVHAHGGELSVAPAQPRGTIFSISLPLS